MARAEPLAASQGVTRYIRVMFEYTAGEQGALRLSVGDIMEVYTVLSSGWADGSKIVPIEDPPPRGWFPSNYVKEIASEEAAWSLEQAEDANSAFARRNAAFDQERRPSTSSTGSNDVWARLSGGQTSLAADAQDLGSFSQGGDIFAEIAAASYGRRPSTQTNGHRVNGSYDGLAEDFWEPRIAEDGQIFYLNSRTGETSRDPPEDLSLAAQLDQNELRAKHASELSMTGAFHNNLHREQSMRRPANAGENGALPTGWVAKTLQDGQTTYYENTRTRETRWSLPRSVQMSSDGSWGHSSSSSSVDLSQEMMSLDTLARSMQGQSAKDDTPPTSGQPSTFRYHQSSLSFDSDESAVDANIKSAAAQQKAAKAAGKGKHQVEERVQLPPELEALEPILPSIESLQQDIEDAVEELTAFVRPTAEQAETEVDRDRLATLAFRLIRAVGVLLSTVGILDPALRSSTSPPQSAPLAFTLSEGQLAQLRPYSKKITSPLNKLVLSSRALWGTMWTTSEEEKAAQEMLVLLEIAPEDLVLLQNGRADVLKMRAESEFQLRSDVASKATDIGKAVVAFVDFLNGPGRDVHRKRPRGAFRTTPNSMLGPGAGPGGHWRSNGFDLLPASAAASTSTTKIPHLEYSYPTQSLSAQSVEQIKKAQVELSEEVANLKGAVAGVVAQSGKRASVLSTRSHLSDFSNASTSGGTPLSVVATASKHLPKIAAQTMGVSQKLTQLLSVAEELDLAAQLDLDFDPADVKALLDYAQSNANSKGKAKATERTEQESAYRETIEKAREALASLGTVKQALYNTNADLLLAMQTIALSEVCDNPVSKSYVFAHSQAQPSLASPLNDFRILSQPTDPLNAFLTTLAPLDGSLVALSSTFTDLLSVVEKQSGVPKEMRVTSEQARARLSMQRLSQLSFKTGDYNDRDDVSEKGTVTNVYRTTQVRATPPSSNASDSSLEEKLFYTQDNASADRVQSSSLSQTRSQNGDYAESFRSESESVRSGQFATRGLGLHVSKPSADSSDVESGSSSPVTRSPSNNKLRKIFGENVPATVSGNMPDFLQGDYNDELSHTMDGLIKGGTLRALVARLTSHELVDSAYNQTFLMTYRSFATPMELIRLLFDRYSIMPPLNLTAEQFRTWTDRKQKPIRIRTINILKTWVETFYNDTNAEVILSELERFAGSGLGDSSASQQLFRTVERRRANGVPRRMSAAGISTAPSTIVPRRLGKIKFMDLDPLEVARQLTIMNSRFFQRITADECLSKAWPKKIGVDTPNIAQMIAFDNATTHWVIVTVLSVDDMKKRASVIKQFINIAEKCLKLQNFSTLMHIIAALENSNVRRLRRTWDLVNARTMLLFNSMAELMSPNKNSARYRDALKSVGPPCVPFLGIFLTSWTFIGDGMPDFLKEKPTHINFIKRRKAAELLLQIELHQSAIYNLSPVRSIVEFLDNAFSSDKSNEDLWEMSLALEPKEREDEKIARLLSESGFL